MFRSTLIAAITTPVFMCPVIAQDSGGNASDMIVESQEGEELRGDWILGARVYTPDGETIGSIEDLILSSEDGSVNAAIVSVGGFLGFGAKEIAVDWSQLDINYDANEVTLGITRDAAEEAPEYSFRERESAPVPTGDAGAGTGVSTGVDSGTGTGTGTTGTTTGN